MPAYITQILSIVALALFVTAIVGFASKVFPLQLLQPIWLVNFISALLDAAPLALIGLLLIHLAAFFEPDIESLQNRRDFIARLATWVTIGYLLLIPFQAISSFQGFELVRQSQLSRMKVAEQESAALSRAIREAMTAKELEDRIAELQGPGLKLERSASSLPELKQTLLRRLETSKQGAIKQLSSPLNPSYWAIAQRSLRVVILSFFYALAFAAASLRKASGLSLLSELEMRWIARRATSDKRNHLRTEGTGGELGVYFDAEMDEEHRHLERDEHPSKQLDTYRTN